MSLRDFAVKQNRGNPVKNRRFFANAVGVVTHCFLSNLGNLNSFFARRTNAYGVDKLRCNLLDCHDFALQNLAMTLFFLSGSLKPHSKSKVKLKNSANNNKKNRSGSLNGFFIQPAGGVVSMEIKPNIINKIVKIKNSAKILTLITKPHKTAHHILRRG